MDDDKKKKKFVQAGIFNLIILLTGTKYYGFPPSMFLGQWASYFDQYDGFLQWQVCKY